jgi:phospholipid transport system substrate-binding protein
MCALFLERYPRLSGDLSSQGEITKSFEGRASAMSFLKGFTTCFCFTLLLFGSPCMASSATGSATVKSVLDKAMDIQTQANLQGEANVKKRAGMIRQLISENFDAEAMARESIKENWDKLTPGQRAEFQKIFTSLFQDSYTRMVLNFLQREKVEYRSESPEAKGVKVQTTIMRANEHIPVDYHLAQRNGRWLITDVDIDGVSIVENYRNTFRRIIQSSSFDNLLQKMRSQSQAIQGGEGSG